MFRYSWTLNESHNLEIHSAGEKGGGGGEEEILPVGGVEAAGR